MATVALARPGERTNDTTPRLVVVLQGGDPDDQTLQDILAEAFRLGYATGRDDERQHTAS